MEGHLFGMISILLKINRGELFLPKAFLNGFNKLCIFPFEAKATGMLDQYA